MGPLPEREEEFVVDLENGGVSSDGEFTKVVRGFSNLDEIEIGLNGNSTDLKKLGDGEEKKKQKEKRKSMSAAANNKPPRRPPRYPKSALSLDAADQRLINEISRIAMIKHARDERMKALKKMKAAKASSSSSGNLFAMITTFLFCLLLIFHGMSSCKRLTINIQSPHPSWAARNHIVSFNNPSNTSTTIANTTLPGPLEYVIDTSNISSMLIQILLGTKQANYLPFLFFGLLLHGILQFTNVSQLIFPSNLLFFEAEFDG